MTITIEITPEVKAELARQAALQGGAIEAHAASLLERAAHLSPDADSMSFDRERAKAAGDRIRELQGRHAWGPENSGVDG